MKKDYLQPICLAIISWRNFLCASLLQSTAHSSFMACEGKVHPAGSEQRNEPHKRRKARAQWLSVVRVQR